MARREPSPGARCPPASSGPLLGRRALLRGVLGVAAGAAWPLPAPAGTASPPLFSLGVASGDPTHRSVVLWTRLAPDPLRDGGMPPEPVEVVCEVAADPGLKRGLRRIRTLARPEKAHAVHVKLRGLEPDRWYWYRFHALGEASRVGRTRTFPAPGSGPSRMRFALASCQHYEAGFYAAYEGMVADDLDFVVHVGDYIYEGAANPRAVRQHEGPEPTTLAGYRRRHALYKLDPSLQAAHAAYPFVLTWDDHEVENNYAGLVPEAGGVSDSFRARREAAYRAWAEHQPLSRRSRKGLLRLARRLRFGDLASLFVLDTRQYRSDQACGGSIGPQCPEVFQPGHTLLGRVQARWLEKSLPRSDTVWQVIAQQVILTRWDFGTRLGLGPAFNLDAWDGYPLDQARVHRLLGRLRLRNPVVLTGDVHSTWIADLKADYRDERSPAIGVEFVGTSITSRFDPALLPIVEGTLETNPHIRFFEGTRHGYLRCTVDPDFWRTDVRVVDDLLDPLSPVHTLASFGVEAGRPGVIRL